MQQRGIFSTLFDALLLALVVLPPALAVVAARLDPVLPFGILVWIVLAALGVGLVFAHSAVPEEMLHPLALFGGTAVVFFVVAQVMPGVDPDTSLGDRLRGVVAQVAAWFQVVSSGGQATNNLLFLLLLALIAWMIGYFGAWAVFRARSAWWPVTASAAALMLVLANFPDLFGYMLVLLIGAMLLIGRVNLELRQLAWQSAGLRQSGELAGRAFRASLALAIALVALAWIAPTVLASQPISERLGRSTQPWQQAQTEFNRLFGGLQAQNQASLSGFSRAMTLHGSFHLADTPVLQISSPRPEYWRAIVYDQYTGHGWLSSDPIDQRTLPAGTDALRPSDLARTEIDQQVRVLAPRGSYLVGASQPFRFDRTVSAQAYADAPSGGVDLVATLSTTPLQPGSHYAVASDVSDASAAELRAASVAYPAEIHQRYLSLPPIPERVHQLAVQLTAPEQDPYDKAVAIESYLRTMPYTLDLPPPPSDRDAVDYFLFDAKTGYCDYFASSMAVLARSVGIPARVVSGYATGDRQDDGTFLVKDSNSHSWTEVYLPPYGWIPFEPSGSWPRFERGSGDQSAATPTPALTPRPVPNLAQGQSQLTPTPTPSPTPSANATAQPETLLTKQPLDLQPLLPFLYLLGALALAGLVLWYLWERGLRGLPPSAVAYAKMTRLAGWLGFGLRSTETPEEYGQALAGALPRVGTSIQRITSAYGEYRFGHHADERGDVVLRLWRFVRNALIRRIGRLRRE
ncbi:MAG TPA: transglutaminaseTgpA domain-containing protein [Chloroflexota bacterium]|nr:transglutaminaseTgpA domain-containing protein [Chloroflexota bacterium]